MSVITTRLTKGSALSWTQMDANLNNLNNDKLELATIHSYSNKVTPIDTDEFLILNSESEYSGNKITWNNIKTTLSVTLDSLYLKLDGSNILTGNLNLGSGNGVVFEGSADDSYETTLSVVNPTSDRTILLQDASYTIAGIDIPQVYTVPQKSTVTTDNDLSFDLSTGMDFVCTPTGAGTLGFTNITAGQKFEILLTNAGSYAIAKGSNIKCPSTLFATISATGRYILAGRCLDGTNVDLTVSSALS